MKKIFNWLFGSQTSIKRLNISDVNIGQNIYIELERSLGRITHAKCLSNDTYSKKIIVLVLWETKGVVTKERIILSYDNDAFKNFHLLNKNDINIKDDKDDIISIQKQLDAAIANENFELADILQKKIDKIKKNK